MDNRQTDLLNLILKRSSYRGKYHDRPVYRKDLTVIMEAGLSAPSGRNKQTTSLLVVDDPVLLQRLKSLLDPPICETAPALICVLTQRVYAYRDKGFAVQDYSAAIENMLLAINALGYESCWYEGHITDADNLAKKLADALGVPAKYELVCLLPVGYAAENEIAHSPKKKPFEKRAWFNSIYCEN